jgi:hypothetical protein
MAIIVQRKLQQKFKNLIHLFVILWKGNTHSVKQNVFWWTEHTWLALQTQKELKKAETD